MFTIEDARNNREYANQNLIIEIENQISDASKTKYSVSVKLPKEVTLEDARRLAKVFQSAPRNFENVRVDSISTDNYGPVEYYMLTIKW